MKRLTLVIAALLLSAGVYAQSPATPPATAGRQPGHGKLTPDQKAARKAERRATFDKMTPDERNAFRNTHRANRQARLDAMPADKRAKMVERHRVRKMQRKEEKVK